MQNTSKLLLILFGSVMTLSLSAYTYAGFAGAYPFVSAQNKPNAGGAKHSGGHGGIHGGGIYYHK